MERVQSLLKFKKGAVMTPTQVVEKLGEDLAQLADPELNEKDNPERLDALRKEIAKMVLEAKAFIYGHSDGRDDHSHAGGGGGGTAPFPGAHDDPLVIELATAIATLGGRGILELMQMHFHRVDFETRKNWAHIFVYLVKHDVAGFSSKHMLVHTESVLQQLITGYAQAEVALPCGAMLRECIKSEQLHAEVFSPGFGLRQGSGALSDAVQSLFTDFVRNPNFEVAADAFETLTALLTTNKALVFKMFNPDGPDGPGRYDDLVRLYNDMLREGNYVLKRQSLKLLSEFLLDRDNFRIMMRYISDRENLKLIMKMLQHPQANIQFEAFHVFKVFVANPEKPDYITEILALNKTRLIRFLEKFLAERDDDTQFAEEKAMLIDTLSKLPDLDVAVGATPGGPLRPSESVAGEPSPSPSPAGGAGAAGGAPSASIAPPPAGGAARGSDGNA